MLKSVAITRLWKALVVILLAFSITACQIYWTKTGNAEDPENSNNILVYGFFDDSDAPFKFRWGQIRQVLPKTDDPFLDIKLNKEGLFYLENLPVGSYVTETFGGPEGMFSNTSWRWRLPSPSQYPEFKLSELRATKPGLHFMGAYKVYESKKGGFFSNAEYSTLAVQKPSEIEILEQLREKTRGSKWDSLVVAKINELKKRK